MAVGESTATIGTPGDVVSTYTVDEVDGVTVSEREIQRILISYVTASGKVTTVDATTGLPVSIVGGSFSLESGADPLTTGNDIDVVESIPTISTSIYTANDVVGGRITLTNAMGTLKSGILQNVFVQFKSGITPDLDIYLFNALPTQNTVDNAAFAWNTADDAKLIWVQHVLTANYVTIPGATPRTFAPVLCGYPAVKSTDLNLYAYIVAVDSFTASSTSGLRLGVGLARD